MQQPPQSYQGGYNGPPQGYQQGYQPNPGPQTVYVYVPIFNVHYYLPAADNNQHVLVVVMEAAWLVWRACACAVALKVCHFLFDIYSDNISFQNSASVSSNSIMDSTFLGHSISMYICN